MAVTAKWVNHRLTVSTCVGPPLGVRGRKQWRSSLKIDLPTATMDPHGSSEHDALPRLQSTSAASLPSPPTFSPADPNNNPCLSPSSPPVIRTAQTYLTVLSFTPCQASSACGAQSPLQPSDRSCQPLPASCQSLSWRKTTLSTSPSLSPSGSSPSTSNPYPAPDTPPSFQVSVIIPSPDVHPSTPPVPSCWPEGVCPDLECSICFSQFNNVFRCPKMLQCRHTFCLECLARINVKSAEPDAIQCPLCRGLTPLPTLGLPKLATDPAVLAYLPATMQKVYSVRFQRNKGKLQVKRPTHLRWGQRSSLRSVDRSLDVGLPSPPLHSGHSEAGGVTGALFRMTGRPACRAILLTSLVLMMVLLTGIIVFLFSFMPDRRE